MAAQEPLELEDLGTRAADPGVFADAFVEGLGSIAHTTFPSCSWLDHRRNRSSTIGHDSRCHRAHDSRTGFADLCRDATSRATPIHRRQDSMPTSRNPHCAAFLSINGCCKVLELSALRHAFAWCRPLCRIFEPASVRSAANTIGGRPRTVHAPNAICTAEMRSRHRSFLAAENRPELPGPSTTAD